MINDETNSTISKRIKELRAGCGHNEMVREASSPREEKGCENAEEEKKKEIEE